MRDGNPAPGEAALHGNAIDQLQEARDAHARGDPKRALKLLRARIWEGSPETETLRAIASKAEAIAAETSGRLKSTAEEVAQQANLSIQMAESTAHRPGEAGTNTASPGPRSTGEAVPRGQTVGPTLILSVIAGSLMLIGSIGPWATATIGGIRTDGATETNGSTCPY